MSKIIINNIEQGHKSLLIRAANQSGQKLNDWLINLADREIKSLDIKPPRWMNGLSNRSQQALMSAHVLSPDVLREKLGDLMSIQNLGRNQIEEEVILWAEKNL